MPFSTAQYLDTNESDSHGVLVLYVIFKTRAAVFYLDLKPQGVAEWF